MAREPHDCLTASFLWPAVILFDLLRMQLVPILPVVTKADTMTIKESIQYRTELHRKLQFPLLPGRRGGIHLFQFSEDAMANCLPNNAIAHAAAMRPPFLVVCSNFYNKERLGQPEPELWPERKCGSTRPSTSRLQPIAASRGGGAGVPHCAWRSQLHALTCHVHGAHSWDRRVVQKPACPNGRPRVYHCNFAPL